MPTQLTLLPQPNWKLDEETKRIGRQGIAGARASLEAHGSFSVISLASHPLSAAEPEQLAA